MKQYLALVKITALSLIAIILGVFLFFMGTSVLENAHASYMRSIMRDVVYVTNLEGTSGGTGWVTTKANGDRIIITNKHVCGVAAEGVILITYQGNRIITKVLARAEHTDLCAVEAPPGITSSGFKLAGSTIDGEIAYTLGHPYLESNTVTKGELSGDKQIEMQESTNVLPGECTDKYHKLQTLEPDSLYSVIFGINNICLVIIQAKASSIIILPGNSGSPTVNIYGNVIAVAFAANEFGTRSYHIPLSSVKEFISGLK